MNSGRDSVAYRKAAATMKMLQDRDSKKRDLFAEERQKARLIALQAAYDAGFLPDRVEDDENAPLTSGGVVGADTTVGMAITRCDTRFNAILYPSRAYAEAKAALFHLRNLYGECYCYTPDALIPLATLNGLCDWWEAYRDRIALRLLTPTNETSNDNDT